jgi:hypothetical protein
MTTSYYHVKDHTLHFRYDGQSHTTDLSMKNGNVKKICPHILCHRGRGGCRDGATTLRSRKMFATHVVSAIKHPLCVEHQNGAAGCLYPFVRAKEHTWLPRITKDSDNDDDDEDEEDAPKRKKTKKRRKEEEPEEEEEEEPKRKKKKNEKGVFSSSERAPRKRIKELRDEHDKYVELHAQEINQMEEEHEERIRELQQEHSLRYGELRDQFIAKEKEYQEELEKRKKTSEEAMAKIMEAFKAKAIQFEKLEHTLADLMLRQKALVHSRQMKKKQKQLVIEEEGAQDVQEGESTGLAVIAPEEEEEEAELGQTEASSLTSL